MCEHITQATPHPLGISPVWGGWMRGGAEHWVEWYQIALSLFLWLYFFFSLYLYLSFCPPSFHVTHAPAGMAAVWKKRGGNGKKKTKLHSAPADTVVLRNTHSTCELLTSQQCVRKINQRSPHGCAAREASRRESHTSPVWQTLGGRGVGGGVGWNWQPDMKTACSLGQVRECVIWCECVCVCKHMNENQATQCKNTLTHGACERALLKHTHIRTLSKWHSTDTHMHRWNI